MASRMLLRACGAVPEPQLRLHEVSCSSQVMLAQVPRSSEPGVGEEPPVSSTMVGLVMTSHGYGSLQYASEPFLYSGKSSLGQLHPSADSEYQLVTALGGHMTHSNSVLFTSVQFLQDVVLQKHRSFDSDPG